MKQEKTPTLSGVLQDDEKDYKKRKTLGKIALWSNESENEKAPRFRGILEIPNKGKFRISLWDKAYDKEEDEGEESPSLFDNKAKACDFVCRYCGKCLEDSDLLWDACNSCASEKEGLQVSAQKSAQCF